MEIRQLKYFIQICKDKSFSKAAENLHISQQALSKTIKNLEDELKVSILVRSTKGVELTDMGKLLLEKSQKIVTEFDSISTFLYDTANLNKERISIGVPPQLYTYVFAPIACKFEEEFPGIKLDILEAHSSICEENVENNNLDIACTVKPINSEKLQFIPLVSYDFILLVSNNNSLARKSIIKLNDLKNENFIINSPESKTHQLTVSSCLQSGFNPNITFTTSHPQLIVELVSLNKGINILPRPNSFNAAIKNNDKVSVISIDDFPCKLEIGFVVNKNRDVDYIRNTFIEFTLNFFKENET